MPSLILDRLEQVEREMFDRAVYLLEEFAKQLMGADGRAYGDVSLDRGDRIARFEDMATRGVLDILEVMSPPTYDQLLRQYVQDVAESPLVRMP